MATAAHTEAAFERLIVSEMVTSGGWLGEISEGAPNEHRGYDPALGLYPEDLLAFLRATQAKAWEWLVALAGSEHNARTSLLKRVAAQLDKRGTVEVLRRGFSEKGVALRLAYFEPDLKVDATAGDLYDENRCGSSARCASTWPPGTASTSCSSSTASRPRPLSSRPGRPTRTSPTR